MLLASNYDMSKYFKAEDFPAEKKLRIKSVTEEQVGPTREKKLVCWFTNDARGLVLNRVNNRAIRGAFGDAVDGWAGKVIILFPTEDDFRGKTVPVVRVRIPPPTNGGGKEAAPQKPGMSPRPAAVDDDLNDEVSF